MKDRKGVASGDSGGPVIKHLSKYEMVLIAIMIKSGVFKGRWNSFFLRINAFSKTILEVIRNYWDTYFDEPCAGSIDILPDTESSKTTIKTTSSMFDSLRTEPIGNSAANKKMLPPFPIYYQHHKHHHKQQLYDAEIDYPFLVKFSNITTRKIWTGIIIKAGWILTAGFNKKAYLENPSHCIMSVLTYLMGPCRIKGIFHLGDIIYLLRVPLLLHIGDDISLPTLGVGSPKPGTPLALLGYGKTQIDRTYNVSKL